MKLCAWPKCSSTDVGTTGIRCSAASGSRRSRPFQLDVEFVLHAGIGDRMDVLDELQRLVGLLFDTDTLRYSRMSERSAEGSTRSAWR